MKEINKTLEKAKSWELEIWSGEAERGFLEIELDDVTDVIDSIAFLQNENKTMSTRVQELEKRLKIYQKRSWFEDYEKVAKQNKRYRAILDDILKHAGTYGLRNLERTELKKSIKWAEGDPNE